MSEYVLSCNADKYVLYVYYFAAYIIVRLLGLNIRNRKTVTYSLYYVIINLFSKIIIFV